MEHSLYGEYEWNVLPCNAIQGQQFVVMQRKYYYTTLLNSAICNRFVKEFFLYSRHLNWLLVTFCLSHILGKTIQEMKVLTDVVLFSFVLMGVVV